MNYHYIQDIIEKAEIIVWFITSTKMVAALLTNWLSLDKFIEHIVEMGLTNT